MSELRSYAKILTLGHRALEPIADQHVVVEEKVDGSQSEAFKETHSKEPPVGPARQRVNRAPAFPLPNRRQRRAHDRFVAHPPTARLRACGHWGRR